MNYGIALKQNRLEQRYVAVTDSLMIGSALTAMHKYIWKPIWVLKHKFKALFSKHPYSMYENKIVRDYRDGKVTKEELDKCSNL